MVQNPFFFLEIRKYSIIFFKNFKVFLVYIAYNLQPVTF